MRRIMVILSVLFVLVAGTAFAQFESKGNMSYEELVAISFDSQSRSLVGTIAVKLPGGYNGNHVVACWVDWNDNGVFTAGSEYVGAGTRYTPNPVTVPPFVYYGVQIPISPPPGTLNKNHSVKCIMSWMQEITGPNFDPVWGNSLLGKIHVDPQY